MGDIADYILEGDMNGFWGEEEYDDGESSGFEKSKVYVYVPILAVARETDKAWLIEAQALSNPTWFPKSMCKLDPETKDKKRVLAVPDWLALKKPELNVNLCQVL